MNLPPEPAAVIHPFHEDRRLLATIHQLENPTNSQRPGSHGELGPYHFTRQTWEHLTHLPFTAEYACDPDISFAVAVLHLAEIRLALRKAGRMEMPSTLAMCWNAGTTAVIGGIVPPSTLDYVQRFSNLYYGPGKEIQNKH